MQKTATQIVAVFDPIFYRRFTMSQPIHMLYLIKRKEAWYQLSDEERSIISKQTLDATIKLAVKDRSSVMQLGLRANASSLN